MSSNKNVKKATHLMLRYTLLPDNSREERIRELVKFCVDTGIGEVIFFINAEEFNDGHLTLDETRIWLDAISEAKEALSEINVSTSLNPWHTLLHGDRGRKLRENQNFQLMVDPYGNMSTCCVCPLCPEWRKYIKEIFKLYASIKPKIIFVDDDFRYHNHAPLIWGGCFCPIHIEKFSEVLGKRVTREEVVRKVLKPGKPHPYRRLWLNLFHEGLKSLAEELHDAVKSVSNETKIGLMCSDPTVHAAEGRNWNELIKALCGDKPIVRPHGGPYTEASPPHWHSAFALLMHTIALLPKGTYICPEIENFPFTRFSKSVTQTSLQITFSQLIGSNGVTLDLFDFMGNGVSMEPKYGEMLIKGRAYWDAIGSEHSGQGEMRGVKVIFNPESSYHTRTERGESWEELYTQDRGWAVHLSSLGVSYAFSTINDLSRDELAAISGKMVYSLSHEDIRKLLRGRVLLDGQAIRSLSEMGFGELIGVKEANWLNQREAVYSFEEMIDGDFMQKGLRMTAQLVAPDRLLGYKLMNDCRVISEIYTAKRTRVTSGLYLFKNKLGGKVVGIPYVLENRLNVAFLNYIRQEGIQRCLKWLESDIESGTVLVKGEPHILPVRIDFEEKIIIGLFNLTSDSVDSILFETSRLKPSSPLILEKDGSWRKARAEILTKRGIHTRILVKEDIWPQSEMILKFQKP